MEKGAVKHIKGKIGKKQLILLVLSGVVGLLLIIFPVGEKKSEVRDNTFTVTSYTEKLEKRVRELCLAVDGINKVEVLLTLESGSEYVYADNVKEEKETGKSWSYTSDYLIVNNGNGTSAVPVTEIYPKIRGVAVVCNGGGRADVQKKLTELLSAALGIPSSRIKITS